MTVDGKLTLLALALACMGGTLLLLGAAKAKGSDSNARRTEASVVAAGDGWTEFRGETKCKGMKVAVSFSYNHERKEVRDFALEDSCQDPAEDGGGLGMPSKQAGESRAGRRLAPQTTT
jgi:hypothetical protein